MNVAMNLWVLEHNFIKDNTILHVMQSVCMLLLYALMYGYSYKLLACILWCAIFRVQTVELAASAVTYASDQL